MNDKNIGNDSFVIFFYLLYSATNALYESIYRVAEKMNKKKEINFLKVQF